MPVASTTRGVAATSRATDRSVSPIGAPPATGTRSRWKEIATTTETAKAKGTIAIAVSW